jgi:hypothetical protein
MDHQVVGFGSSRHKKDILWLYPKGVGDLVAGFLNHAPRFPTSLMKASRVGWAG